VPVLRPAWPTSSTSGRRSACRLLRIIGFLPEIGQELAVVPPSGHDLRVPSTPDPALVARIAASTGISATEAARVVEDVTAFYAEPVEDYVRRRHAHLKTYGAKNAEIFARIAEELADRVVAAPRLSERQLRRIVYG
jgi:hypothetical protein